MTEKRIGRFTVSVELASAKTDFGGAKYDTVLSEEDKVIKQHLGCYGLQSAEYWEADLIKVAERLEVLHKRLDQVNHNLMCYSATLLMNSPKEGYEEQWAITDKEQKIIAGWLDELEA